MSESVFRPGRRDFLKAGGSLVVSFALASKMAEAAAQDPAAAAGKKAKTVALDQVDGFLAIDAQGNVTVFSGKVDLGTGVRTAMAQIAAEELSVPLAKVQVVQGDTALTPDQGVTFGSLSIQNGGMQIRQAAATARAALIAKAAEALHVAKDDLTVRDGVVAPRSGGKGLSYGKLLGGRDFELKLDPKAPLKNPTEYTLVGKPVARLDIPAKVTGRFTYMHDFKLPGMLHARTVRPTALKANLESADDSACKAVAGYAGMVRKGNFLAVLARSEWGAIRAARAVQAKWSRWEGLPEQSRLWEYVRSIPENRTEELQKVGEPGPALGAPGARLLRASYDFAIHTHGSIGPSCAVAEMKDGKLTVWTASQATHLLRKQLASMLQLDPEAVRCIYIEGSGCYGRNGHEDAAADAALLAKETGRAVRVQWMRQDEHGWDPKGPPTLHDFKAALGEGGKITAWESHAYIPDKPKDVAVSLLAADLVSASKEVAHPGNIQGSLAIPYTVPNVRATAHWLAETPFRPSWIRTPGRMQNTFANESFMDELAAAAGVDPLAFRLRNLNDPRGAELLERLGKLAAWTPRTERPRPEGEVVRGRGVAYVKYELVRTYVGAVADVEVNRKTGKVRVTRFFIAHDCGQIINPDGLRNQIEGNVIQTVSRTLLESLQFNRSTVTSLDWSTYPILAHPDVPHISIELIDRPAEKPWGAGEPTASVVPGAIANAIFDAAQVRLRSVPFTPDKVKAGLAV